jgi:galactitol-specific phosphotransferase system IIC component
MTKLRVLVFGATAAVAMVMPCASASASAVTQLPQDVPVACAGGNSGFGTMDTGNFLGAIISAAFDVAKVGVDAAEGIALTAVGAAKVPGASC